MTDSELIQKIRAEIEGEAERIVASHIIPGGRVIEGRVQVDLRLRPETERIQVQLVPGWGKA